MATFNELVDELYKDLTERPLDFYLYMSGLSLVPVISKGLLPKYVNNVFDFIFLTSAITVVYNKVK